MRLAERLGWLALALLSGALALDFPFQAPPLLQALALLAHLALLLGAARRGLPFRWLFLQAFLGLAISYAWVPATLESKGPMPYPAALGAAGLLMAWEALAMALIPWASARAGARSGPWAAACAAGLGVLLYELGWFHVYPWSWSVGLVQAPWIARSAAFLTAHGTGALAWALMALFAFRTPGPRGAAAGAAAFLASAALLAGLWALLPRGPERSLDLVLAQPNWAAGTREPFMEERVWAQVEPSLHPVPERRTLLVWPESSVLGRDDRGEQPRLREEARRRGVAWLFGTEGGLYNLVRGEVDGGPGFLQAKVEPMPFGERMPGPEGLRHWLDERMGFLSQEPGALTAASSFRVPTPEGELRVHPLICSEALLYGRTRDGVALAGADLLANLTNDGWFERSRATDLHGAEVRARAVEMGVPLVRATLTGKSGLFREDGTGTLWGEPMTRATWAFTLRWRPVRTPARTRWPLILLTLGFGIPLAALIRRPRGPAPAA